MTFREGQLVRVLVRMADTLVSDFEIADLFQELVGSCPGLVDAAAAGLLLADEQGALRVAAASSEAAHIVELLEIQNEGGPGSEAFRTAKPVTWTTATPHRWPQFAESAQAAGLQGATAVPMRLRQDVLGALTIFRAHPKGLTGEDVVVVQALADLATIAILQHRSTLDDQSVISQLREALDSRVVIEQAKGVVAQETGLDMDEAFRRMRAYARNHNFRLRAVAERITSGDLKPQGFRHDA